VIVLIATAAKIMDLRCLHMIIVSDLVGRGACEEDRRAGAAQDKCGGEKGRGSCRSQENRAGEESRSSCRS
jgi:hypothetical protein